MKKVHFATTSEVNTVRNAEDGESRLLSLEFLQARPDERENLLTLERLLTYAKGFALAFAQISSSHQRDALVQEIRRRLEPKGFTFVEVEFATPVPDFLAELVRRLNSLVGKRWLRAAKTGSRFVIFVYGLERSISPSATYNPALAVINYKRENFRNRIPAPLVLWLPEDALQALIEGAPDFWAWRSGVFEFDAQKEKI